MAPTLPSAKPTAAGYEGCEQHQLCDLPAGWHLGELGLDEIEIVDRGEVGAGLIGMAQGKIVFARLWAQDGYAGSKGDGRLPRRFPVEVNHTTSSRMPWTLTDDEAAALTSYLRQKPDDERFPLATRLDPLKLAKLEPPAPRPEPLPPRWARAAQTVKRYSGPPMALGNAASARVRLIVWCLDCRHQVEPDPAEIAERYGAEMPVPDWRGGS